MTETQIRRTPLLYSLGGPASWLLKDYRPQNTYKIYEHIYVSLQVKQVIDILLMEYQSGTCAGVFMALDRDP